jgi:hypothetical protein
LGGGWCVLPCRLNYALVLMMIASRPPKNRTASLPIIRAIPPLLVDPRKQPSAEEDGRSLVIQSNDKVFTLTDSEGAGGVKGEGEGEGSEVNIVDYLLSLVEDRGLRQALRRHDWAPDRGPSAEERGGEEYRFTIRSDFVLPEDLQVEHVRLWDALSELWSVECDAMDLMKVGPWDVSSTETGKMTDSRG